MTPPLPPGSCELLKRLMGLLGIRWPRHGTLTFSFAPGKVSVASSQHRNFEVADDGASAQNTAQS